MDKIYTKLNWHGPGWYAGGISNGIDHWIQVADADQSVDDANHNSWLKGCGTPRYFIDATELETFDEVI